MIAPKKKNGDNMKKTKINEKVKAITSTLLIAIFMISAIISIAPAIAKKEGIRIQDSILQYSAGHYLGGTPLVIGYDEFGYNYQAHMFNGYYCNAYLGRAGSGLPPYEGDAEAYLAANPAAASHWTWPYRDVVVMMQWNDAWISNMDRDSDGLLDRGYTKGSTGPYTDSGVPGAWLTNHMRGVNVDGTRWEYYTKIVAAPADAYVVDEVWYTADGVEIGPVIWGAFATIQKVSNDPAYDEHGVLYNSPSPTGFGYYIP